MSQYSERFAHLIQQVAPLDAESAKLKFEMVRLAGEIALEIVTDAFPEAQVLRLRAVSEIKPSDNGKSARTAVEMLAEAKVTPTLIIHDEARHIVLLLVEPLLPRAAKPTAKKKVANRTNRR